MRRHSSRSRWLGWAPSAVVLLAVVAAGCAGSDNNTRVRVANASPDLGAKAIRTYGCGSCHTIPGIKGADALVGPPLIHWSRRAYIAGQLTNTPDNLARWIQNPQEVEPGTDMPDLDVTADEARNIGAYLLQIQ